MVDGPKVDCDHESRQPGGEGDKNQAHPGIAVRGGCFVVEEPLKKMADQVRELAPLRRSHRAKGRLLIEAKHLWIGHQKQPLDCIKHGCSA